MLPELLVGEYPYPEDIPWLRAEHGVGAIVNLQDPADLAAKGLAIGDLAAACAGAGVEFRHFPVPDGDNEALLARLDGIVAALAELVRAGKRVYLHCNAGCNRAPTAAIAYLHAQRGLSLAAAAQLVKERRTYVPYMRVLEQRYGPDREQPRRARTSNSQSRLT